MNNDFRRGKSVYGLEPKDKLAVYFKAPNYDVCNDGTSDVSEELQRAINDVITKYGYGILYIPEGEYLLSRTIYIPKAVRVIGYGKNRPVFVLQDNAKDFDKPKSNDKGGFRYLFWFTANIITDENAVDDANPGTFYSCMSNVDICLGEGNSYAVALRTHYAQHSFVSHINIDVMSGMAGIYDVGNEMEDISIYNGNYAIITTKCSPGWPFMMVDTYFEGQRIAAIKTREAGLTIVRNKTCNTPVFMEVDSGKYEKLYIEASVFENITECAFKMAMDKNTLTHIIATSLLCKNVNCFARYEDSGREVSLSGDGLVEYTHGTVVYADDSARKFVDSLQISEVMDETDLLKTDIVPLPDMERWIDVTELGLVGDGVTDNSPVIDKVIEAGDVLYFPQGEYLFTKQIKLRENTAIIAMHPYGARLILKENSEDYTGIGPVKGFVETPLGGKNILNGIGIDTGGRNPRAAAVVWRSGADSYVNDVKLVGGHGNLVPGTGLHDMPYNESRSADKHTERIWDGQYASFLVIGGGGTFKDIWTASTYATAGFEVRDSNIESKVYCISLEHHQRTELVLNNTSNWSFYAIQTEEELAEGVYAVPFEIRNSSHIRFNTAYFFRTVWVCTALDQCVKCYDSYDIVFNGIFNMSQMKYTITNFLKDYRNNTEVRLWDAAKVIVGEANQFEYEYDEASVTLKKAEIERCYTGFRFADGGVTDSKGNFYFVDSLDKRVYKIDGESLSLSVVLESPIKVNSIALDTNEELIFIAEYKIPIESTLNGEPMIYEFPADSFGTSYGYWYSNTSFPFVFMLKDGEIVPLEKVDMNSVKAERICYPGNRHRDSSDFEEVVVYDTKKAYLALDGKTIIPDYYDWMRCNTVTHGIPGGKIYCVDEYYKRTYVMDIADNGLLKNPVPIVEEGDYNVVASKEYLVVCEDNIKLYNYDGIIKEVIKTPKRPTTVGLDKNGEKVKFVTTRSEVYILK